MPEDMKTDDDPGNSLDDLRSRTASLEARLDEMREQTDARVIRAGMKAEAIRAGMIDLDCLQFLDLSVVRLSDQGEVVDAPGLITQLKKAKPWLFSPQSSSSLLNAPSALPPRQKHATEMTVAEYAAARAALLKHAN